MKMLGNRLLSRPRSCLQIIQVHYQSSWAAVPKRQRRISTRQRRQRPLVNGEAIAFHVNELPRASFLNNNAVQVQSQQDYDSNLIVVLDMDECLLHSQFLSSQAARFAHQVKPSQQKLNNGSTTTTLPTVDSFRVVLPDNGELVHVNIRPGLPDFLKRVTERFETHIFTAAMEVYAKPVLDRLDPDNKLAGRWYREHCRFDREHGAYVKYLQNLPFDSLDRVVLVDNNPLSFLENPENGILVSSFYNDPTDKTLPAVWELLQDLDENHKDVRPHLKERFGLEQALKQLLNNSSE